MSISDPFSSVSHLVGALLGLLFVVPLLRRASGALGPKMCLGAFGFSVVLLLGVSGAYHLLPYGSGSREVLQRLDHAGIFVLIAGTFTAGHGLFFRGFWRGGMIAMIWTVGIVGAVVKVCFFDAISEGTGLLLYLSMGWLGALSIVKLVLDRKLRPAAYLCAGGVLYTLGAVGDFWGANVLSLLPGWIGAHELFHMAVLGGIAIHWKLFHVTAGAHGRLSSLKYDPQTPTR